MGTYKKNSLTLAGAVSLGTGVMIGAAIFALLGQVAELSGGIFPLIFLVGALVMGLTSYTYIKVSNVYPSAGGIAMILQKAYGKTATTAGSALLMAFAMVINQSLVARTFGSYIMQLFEADSATIWVPILGVLLLIITFLVNISGNRTVERSAMVMATLKIIGIAIFAIGGLWAAGFSFENAIPDKPGGNYGVPSYLGALAITMLAYAGFTTITNSGEEIKKPHRNVGRAILISLVISAVIYLVVAFAVSSNLSVEKIIQAKDYSMAEAARPAFGKYGVWFTVGIAIIATVSGLIANVFAVSRMTAMLTNMKLIPHSHFGMPGRVQKHMLVYSVVIAIVLTIFFDLTRIASIGAVFYIVMDIVIHWGVLTRLRKKVSANPILLVLAITIDVVILAAFLYMKFKTDLFVVILSLVLMSIIFIGEYIFLNKTRKGDSG